MNADNNETRKYTKIPVELHNYLHNALERGDLTIKNVVAMGISQSNAYTIKNSTAYTGKPTSGRPAFLSGNLKSSFISMASRGKFDSIKRAHEWL